MNIKIDSNFQFSVVSIQYTATGELSICLSSDDFLSGAHYQYSASLGNSKAEERPSVSLLQYAKAYAASANIKPKTRESYMHVCGHLADYGDSTMDKVTTNYLQGFILHLQSKGMKPGSVRLYFQKLACVLHDAYKNGLFDDRILQRVKRPKREQEKKSFLSETELKKLAHHHLSDEYNNIQSMFLFSCMTGLRYSDVQGLRWKDVKRSGKHLQLEFHQQKTDTHERLPLCLTLSFPIRPVSVAALCLQIAKLGKLAKVAFGGSGSETKMIDDNFRRDVAFIAHKNYNIGQFLGQGGLYRPFIDHFLLQNRFIDHFSVRRPFIFVDIGL